MSEITFELLEDCIYFKNNYKYQLEEEARLKIDLVLLNPITLRFIEYKNGVLYIKPGYAWNGASGPALDTPNIMRASLFHDALYQLMEEGFLSWEYRATADKLLKDKCKMDNMSVLRRNYIYYVVKKLGKLWTRISPSVTFVAPK